MRNIIIDQLLDLVSETIEPSLREIPFKSVQEVKYALNYLAEEIENVDPDLLFMELTDGVYEEE